MSGTGLSCSPLLYRVLQQRLRASLESEYAGYLPGEWVQPSRPSESLHPRRSTPLLPSQMPMSELSAEERAELLRLESVTATEDLFEEELGLENEDLGEEDPMIGAVRASMVAASREHLSDAEEVDAASLAAQSVPIQIPRLATSFPRKAAGSRGNAQAGTFSWPESSSSRLRRSNSLSNMSTRSEEYQLQGLSLHWTTVTAMLVCFTWGNSIVAVPYAIVALGFVPSLFMATLLYPAAAFSSLMIFQICIHTRNNTGIMCRNLGDVGNVSLGWGGRVLGTLLHLIIFFCQTPLSLLVAALYLQAILGDKSGRLTVYIVGVLGALHIGVQARNIAKLKLLIHIGFWSLVFVSVHLIHQASVLNSGKNHTQYDTDTDTDVQPTWSHPGLFGLCICIISFNPVSITPELLHMMASPKDFPRAVGTATLLSAIFFVITGGLVASQGGWTLSMLSLVNSHRPVGWDMRLGYLALFLSVLPTYTISATALTRSIQKVVIPQFDDDWSLRSCAAYFSVSLPVLIIGGAVTLLLPLRCNNSQCVNLLIGVMAPCLPVVSLLFPAVAFGAYRYSRIEPATDSVVLAVIGLALIGIVMCGLTLKNACELAGEDIATAMGLHIDAVEITFTDSAQLGGLDAFASTSLWMHWQDLGRVIGTAYRQWSQLVRYKLRTFVRPKQAI